MNKVLSLMLKTIAILFVIVLSIFFISIFWLFDLDPCENTEHQVFESPDHLHSIVLYDKDCGATTDFSTHIAILDVNETLEDGKGIFVADSNHGKANGHPRYSSLIDVNVTWVNNNSVQIEYDRNARIFTKTETARGIRVVYKEK